MPNKRQAQKNITHSPKRTFTTRSYRRGEGKEKKRFWGSWRDDSVAKSTGCFSTDLIPSTHMAAHDSL